MAEHSSQGIVEDGQAQEQPADRKRAQAAHHSDPDNSASHEGTRDPKLSNDGNNAASGKTAADGAKPSGERG